EQRGIHHGRFGRAIEDLNELSGVTYGAHHEVVAVSLPIDESQDGTVRGPIGRRVEANAIQSETEAAGAGPDLPQRIPTRVRRWQCREEVGEVNRLSGDVQEVEERRGPAIG